MTGTSPAVYAAIANVTHGLALDGIAKKGKNQQQGYSFRGIEQVYGALAPLLVEHQLAIIPQVEERIESERATKNGGILYSVAMRVRFVIASSVDGSTVDACVWGEGMDSADKATNKAMSAAYKYMAFMTFCIPVEGMVDADSETPESTQPVKVKAKQAAPPKRTFASPEAAGIALGKCVEQKHVDLWETVAKDSGFLLEELASLLEASKERRAVIAEQNNNNG
jgi:hypothetical protein